MDLSCFTFKDTAKTSFLQRWLHHLYIDWNSVVLFLKHMNTLYSLKNLIFVWEKMFLQIHNNYAKIIYFNLNKKNQHICIHKRKVMTVHCLKLTNFKLSTTLRKSVVCSFAQFYYKQTQPSNWHR